MGSVPSWFHLFLDVPRAEWSSAIEFWTAATGWTASAPRGEVGQFVTLEPAVGDAWLKMQAIDGSPRVHLDLDSPDRAAAVARSMELGALPAWTDGDVQVMRSPGGLLFCHTLADRPRRFARADLERALDQVCIDIPPSMWEREIEFWQAITGRSTEPARTPSVLRLNDPDPHARLRFLLQHLDDEEDSVRAHPDVAVADRAAETARHQALGAEMVAVRQSWTVMRAPYGQVYCLTERNPTTGTL